MLCGRNLSVLCSFNKPFGHWTCGICTKDSCLSAQTSPQRILSVNSKIFKKDFSTWKGPCLLPVFYQKQTNKRSKPCRSSREMEAHLWALHRNIPAVCGSGQHIHRVHLDLRRGLRIQYKTVYCSLCSFILDLFWFYFFGLYFALNQEILNWWQQRQLLKRKCQGFDFEVLVGLWICTLTSLDWFFIFSFIFDTDRDGRISGQNGYHVWHICPPLCSVKSLLFFFPWFFSEGSHKLMSVHIYTLHPRPLPKQNPSFPLLPA